MINAYWELNSKFYAYLVGNIYLAPFYAIGFIIPPLRKIINEYESNGTIKVISFISLISGGLIYGCTTFFVPDFSSSIHVMILWYTGYFVWGFWALILLYDFKQKKKNNS